MVSMGRFSDTPGHLIHRHERWNWLCGLAVHGVVRMNRKTGYRNRLLEQGPAISALLTWDWVVCLPSLDLPLDDLTVHGFSSLGP